ncbi:FMN-dependent NADH-azoreductase [Candidatus Deianiraea vastatrix]|uniref:FMN dependent NADH:quinone oxidoreductase n=1 Tax=Candidatus Deianiraea vastatrix TaxID=2163644 RepID=A0A5B8XDH3_9RICK|nr:NAD(P)H-dependent oxidoreductase [Candidatus Deianiraea vastatrix]QED23409.1 FMN-dependent NADH-azoreductase [Candidatus Deianiraea vastatrix]
MKIFALLFFLFTASNAFATNILVINSSLNSEKDSFTKRAVNQIIEKIKAKENNVNISIRDLAKNPIPHLTSEEIAAFYTPKDKHDKKIKNKIKLSDDLILQLNSSDIAIIASPMINFSVPSSLKAYIDHIVRAGVTFKYENGKPVGLLNTKKVIVVTSSGGIYSENNDMKLMNHNDSYLKTVFSFLGVKNIEVIAIEGVIHDGDKALKNAVDKFNYQK